MLPAPNTPNQLLNQFRSFLLEPDKLSNKTLSSITVKNYVSDLNRFFSWLSTQPEFVPENPLLQQITTEKITLYLQHLRLNSPPSTLSRHTASIRRFISFLNLKHQIKLSPIASTSTPSTPLISVPKIISQFKNYLKEEKKSRSTIKNYTSDLNHFFIWVANNLSKNETSLPNIITSTNLEAYQNYLKSTQTSSSVIKRRTSSLKTFARFAVDTNLLNNDPFYSPPHINKISPLAWLKFSPEKPFKPAVPTNDTITEPQKPPRRFPLGQIAIIILLLLLVIGVGANFYSLNQDTRSKASTPPNTNINNITNIDPPDTITTNTQTLQGYMATSPATINTVPLVNNDGDIIIAATSPTIESTSGTFGIKGEALTLSTAPTSDGDITLSPDGTGQLLAIGNTTTDDFLRITNANLTSGSLISGYIGNDTATGNLLSLTSGSTETDRFTVEAGGQTAINAEAGGSSPIFSTSIAEVEKFLITNTGKVGIGTTSPSSTLDVNGTLESSGGVVNLNVSSSYNATNINTGTSTGTVSIGGGSGSVVVDSNTWDISAAGVASGLTGITTSGTINLSDLTGSRAIFIDSSNNLVTSGASSFLIDSLSDETGTGVAVFDNNPTFGNNIILGSTDGTRYVYFDNGTANNAGLRYESATNKMQYSHDGSSWNDIGSGGASSFSGITSGTNTSAAMVVDTGASLTFSGTGTITASELTCTGCVANSELANDSITFAGDSGSNASALGTTFNVVGGGITTTAVSGNTLTVTSTEADTLATVTARGASTSDLVTLTGGLTAEGTTNINASANYATNINTGTSTGALTLGGGSGTIAINGTSLDVDGSGTIDILAGSTFSLDGTGASNVTATSGNLTLSTLTSGNVVLTPADSLVITGLNCTGNTNGGALTADASGVITCSDDDSGSASDSYWTITNGSLYPVNATLDLFVGGTSTASAKFAVINVNSGTPTLSLANQASDIAVADNTASALRIVEGSNVYLGITTTDNQETFTLNLPVGGVTSQTANLFTSNIAKTVNIGTGTAVDTINLGTSAADDVNIGSLLADVDILGASSVVAGTGDALTITANSASTWSSSNGALVISGDDGLTLTAANTAGITLNSTAGTFLVTATGQIVDVDSASLDIDTSGAVDILAGSTFSLDGTGASNVTATSGDLTLSTVTTGNVVLSSIAEVDLDGTTVNLDGSVAMNIGTTADVPFDVDTSTLDIDSSGAIDILSSSTFSLDGTGASNVTATSGDLTLSTVTTGNVVLTPADNLVFTGLNCTGNTNGGALTADASGVITCTDDDGGGGTSYWTLNDSDGTLYPVNSTLDFFLGGTATTSAKFAVLNMDSGAPTASISGTTANVATYLTGEGNLATTNMAPLTLGGSTTGPIQLSPKGTTGLYVDGNGNVGINTTDPTSLLHLTGAVTGKALAIFDETGDQDIFTASASGVSKFVIDHSGNVGIGTTSPTYTLDVVGDMRISDTGNPGLTIGDGSTGFFKIGSSTIFDNNETKLSFDPDTDGTAEVVFTNDGNVGIGTTSPSSLLSLASTSTSTSFTGFDLDWSPGSSTTSTGDLFSINIGANGTADNLFAVYDNTSDVFTVSQTQIESAVPHNFSAAGDVSMAYDLIFTNQTSADIQSYGPLSIKAGETFESNNLTLTTYNSGDIILDTGAYVGIAMSNPSVELDVTGDIEYTGTITDVSDIRLKENLVPISNPLEIIAGLNAYTFNMIGEDVSNREVGVIAQDVQKVLPEAAKVIDGEGHLGVSYPFLIPIAIEGIKQQQTQIASLSANLADAGITLTNDQLNTFNIVPNQNTQEKNKYQITDITNQVIESVSTFSSSIIANLKAGSIVAQEIATESLTIQGKSLSDYIAQVVTDLLPNTNLISPLAEFDSLTTNTATISGTLYAQNIENDQINQLDQQLNELTQELDTLNTDYATASSILADIQARYSSYDDLVNPQDSSDPLDTSGLETTNATVSADIALGVDGSLVLDDLLVSNTLIASSLSSNLDDTLYIQPLANAPLNLLAGLMTLSPDGKVTVNGDLWVTGSIMAQNLESLRSTIYDLTSQNATIAGQLTLGEPATSSSGFASLLAVFDEQGQQVASINASGSAQFNSLTTQNLVIAAASASSSASINGSTSSNTTAGTSILPAGETEIVITNSNITPNTLIYLTPLSDTNNQVLYVKSKTDTEFTVAINQPLFSNIEFNYWLIQTLPLEDIN